MTRDFKNDPTLGAEQINDLLDDLEIQSVTEDIAARGITARKVALTIRPGNANERDTCTIDAQSLELESTGALCVTSRPIAVGSVFHLSFDRAEFDVAPVLAVCDRCTMLGDAAFEARFKFASEIILPLGRTGSSIA